MSATDVIGYALPITEDRHVLWVPGPSRMAWGELKHLGNTITILAADQNLDTEDIPLLCHDNIYRYEVRTNIQRWGFAAGRMMLWGIIWLVGMDQPFEDLVGGLYLLFGLPLFVGMLINTYQKHARVVKDRFGSLFFSPQIQVVQSDRMAQLEEIFKDGGIIKVLHHLDELGLGHLREIYKRAAWSSRWKCGSPSGQGVLR